MSMDVAPLVIGGGFAFLGLILALTIGGLVGGISLITGMGAMVVGVVASGMGTRAPISRGRDW